MRSASVLLAVAVVVPILACRGGYYGYGPPVQAQVQVNPPPPDPNVQVDVNAQQQQPVDPNAQPQPQPQPQPVADQGDQTADMDPSAVNDFRDALAPYGTWMDDPQYGTIWVPNPAVVGGDFTPYMTAGHWVYDSDYTWVSDWDWGWAPFHYGRWFQAPGRGWAWIPGKEYAGAWVTWRNGDDGYGYVGWAPTAPAFYWRGGQPVTISTPWFQPRYAYIETGNLFQPTFRANVIRDPGRISVIEQRTRPYMPSGTVVVGGNTRMTVRGPAPMRLGLNATVLPRAPAQNPGLQRAYQFSHTRGGQPINNNVRTNTQTQFHPTQNQVRTTEAHPNGGSEQRTNPTMTQTQRTGEHVQVQQQQRPDEHVQQSPVQQQRTPVPQTTSTVRRVTPAETHETRGGRR